MRGSRRVAADLVGLGDMIAVIGAMVLSALWINAQGDVPVGGLDLVRPALVACLIVYFCFCHWRLYDTQDMTRFPSDSGAIVIATAIGTLAVLGLSDADPAAGVTHVLVWPLVSFVVASLLLIVWRRAMRAVLARLAQSGTFDERIAVYGAGVIASRVQAYVRGAQGGLRFIGAFDDRTDRKRLGDVDMAVAGSLADLLRAGREGQVDRIIVALPQAAEQRLTHITRELEQLPVTVHAVTHFSNDLLSGRDSYKVSNLGPVGLLTVKDKPLADWAPIVKRGEDVLISASLLLFFLPVIVIAAAAIKLTSRGPVLFRQRRRGLNHNVIEVLKFRTMTVCEDGNDVRQATGNDTRVTFVGRVMRRSSLDELPQLVNVLRGEMSLVGPRPHALVHDQHWSEMLEHYANRHQVKPGITGLAQVSGLRGETKTAADIQARIDADLEYIATWSLWLDLWILVRTISAVISAKNAH